MNTQKVYLFMSENEYDKLISTGRKDGPKPIYNLHDFNKSNNWLLKKYKEHTGLDTKGLFCGDGIINYPEKNIEDYYPCFMADKMWYLLELNVPSELCFFMNAGTKWHLISHDPVHFYEKESNEFSDFWDNIFQQSETNYPDIFYTKDKNLIKLRNLYLDAVLETFEKLLDLNAEVDEQWCGPKHILPWFPYILKEWIVSTHKFRGKKYEEWIGPNKVDPKTFPALEGYGDSLKIGDSFSVKNWHNENTVYKLIGWDSRKSTYKGEENKEYITLYSKTKNNGISSFCANPQGGDLTFIKL